MNDLINRKAAIEKVRQLNAIVSPISDDVLLVDKAEVMTELMILPSVEPEIIRCKDCFYGYLYSGVYADTTVSWCECKKPDGLNRDVPLDGYCYAAVRRKDDK